MGLKPGDQLGPYEILASLGAGGMGEVYRARDGRLKRDVALKLLPPGGDKARFQAEARALAALNHPNIVAIYDVGDEYLVTELVDGTPLKASGVRSAVDLCAQVADGLAAAHSVGILHRDLKPANILVTREGRVKIIDFGLAKRSGIGAEDETKTEVGTVLGTAAYMAPEQVRGLELDARSDLFSLGSILYEQLAGARPFAGETMAHAMAAILDKDPGDLPESAPSSLREIVYRCLAKDREQRFQTARDLAFALRASGTGTHAAVAAPSRVAWRWPAAFALMSLAFASVYFRAKPAVVASPVRFSVAMPDQSRAGDLNNAGPAMMSPDGKYLAILASGVDGLNYVWIRAMDSLETRKLENTKGAIFPFWSPDSKQVAFFNDGKLQKIAVTGGPALPICDAQAGRGGDWIAEGEGQGTIIFAPAVRAPLMVVSAAGGTPKQITTVDATNKREASHRYPQFLPGGKRFLYHVLTGSGLNMPVRVGSLDGSQATTVMESESRAVYTPPAPGESLGRLLYVRKGVLFSQFFDAGSMQLSGEPAALATGVEASPGTRMPDFSVSSTGVMALRSTGARTAKLSWLDRQGRLLQTLSGEANSGFLRLSPSAKKVAYSREASSNLDVWITDLDRDLSSRFTTDPLPEVTPVWSPDGEQLIYVHSSGPAYLLKRKSTDGSGASETIFQTKESSTLFALDWSPDSRFVTMVMRTKASLDIWALRLEDGKAFPILDSEFNENGGRLSPDGKWILYSSDEGGMSELYVRPFEVTDGRPGLGNGKWQISTGGQRETVMPAWKGDGKEIVYLRRDGALMSVPVRAGATFAVDPPKELFRSRVSAFDMTKDGSRFLVAIAEHSREEEPLTVVLNWWWAFGK